MSPHKREPRPRHWNPVELPRAYDGLCIGRLSYFLMGLVVTVAGSLLHRMNILFLEPPAGEGLATVVGLSMAILYICLICLRLTSIGVSRWWSLLSLTGFSVCLLALVEWSIDDLELVAFICMIASLPPALLSLAGLALPEGFAQSFELDVPAEILLALFGLLLSLSYGVIGYKLLVSPEDFVWWVVET